MKKQKASVFVILGFCLIVCSFFLMLAFYFRVYINAKNRQEIISKLNDSLPDRTLGTPGIYLNPTMPVLEIDGIDYVAILEIPAFFVKFPIANTWDSKLLSFYPARFYGSAYDGTLVIGGSDHPQQFYFCDKIENGTLVTVTDMTGSQFTYMVSGIDRAKHAESKWLTNTDYDLTIFCRDIYAMEYIAVRCVSSCG